MSSKRIFDFLGALICLVCMSPLFVIIYIAFKIGGSNSVIFSQERIGLHGKPFYIYKFRTMIQKSESDGIPRLAQKDDKRLTRLGRFLRSHHLDELPQLWNVLVGDMSFVGYRPERRYFIAQIIAVRPDYVELYALRPGVTSMATLYNGYTDTIEKMIRRLDMDLEYLHNQSFCLDVKILTQTLFRIVVGRKF